MAIKTASVCLDVNFTNRYYPFSELSIHALKFTARLFGLNLSDEQISKLSEAKLNLDPFPDSKKGLEKFNGAKRGRTTIRTAGGGEVTTDTTDRILSIILSNGEAHKSDILLSNSSLRKYFDHIISVEEVRKIQAFLGVIFTRIKEVEFTNLTNSFSKF